ncbi:MAG: ribosomal protein large subunit ribosomal protein [Candidatus Parcubacteria bacterium]|jgi:large subunit ribosomal protein L22
MNTQEQTVRLNYLRVAPRKVRAVADLIRGASVNEAEAQLMFERRRPAKALLKLLRSAVSSAKSVKKLDPEKLIISRITVDQGPMLKRSLPRARGVASAIQKKMSNVTLTLAEGSASAKSRFTIIVKKKVKKQEQEGRAQKKKAAPDAASDRARTAETKPGFFKRVFRRKSV